MTPRLRAQGTWSSERRLLVALVASNALQWLGAGSILPLLPLYLRDHGSSDGLVGAIMAGFFVAALAVQVPVGRLTDRIGRRPVQVGGLLLYAIGSAAFLAVSTPWFALAFRAIQGAGTGATQVASAAMVADAVPEGRRGSAYGALYGGEMAGLAIGPLLGTVLGAGSMDVVFAAAAGFGVLAAWPLLLTTSPSCRRSAGSRPPRTQPWRQRTVVGIALVMTATGLASGVYEACWSLLLHLRGAVAWQIGLSWTLFAAPFVVIVGPAGWLADHLDRRRLALFTVLGSAAFACLYPFVPSVAWLLGLGAAEALAVSVGYPAVMTELSHLVPAARLGEALGFAAAAQTAAIAVAAGVGGALFGIRPWLPFVASAGAMVICAGGLAWLWRPGRATDRARPGSNHAMVRHTR